MIDIGCWPDTDEQWVVLGEKLEKKEVEMTDWIKCSDRLPPYEILVLATDGEHYWVAMRWVDTRGEFFSPQAMGEKQNDPLYWQPLPPLPKDQTWVNEHQ